MKQKQIESKFSNIHRDFLKNQYNFDESLSSSGYSVKYDFMIKKSGKVRRKLKYFVCITITPSSGKNSDSIKEGSGTFCALLATAVKKNDRYIIKPSSNKLLNTYLKRLVNDAKKEDKSSVLKNGHFDRPILTLYKLSIGDLSRKEKNRLEVYLTVILLVLLSVVGIIYGVNTGNLGKIFKIIIATYVLLAFEVGTYFLMKKLSSDGSYSERHLDDAFIKGLGIIAIIDLMIWYGVE